MEEKKLIDAIHGAIFNKDVKRIKEIKDFFKDINFSDLSKMDIKIATENKEIFEWILNHPDYDFNSLFDNYYKKYYSNQELYEYFKVYYKKTVFIIEKYNKKQFIIKPSDFE